MAGENVTTKFRVDISDLKKNIAEANRQIKLAQAEFKNATAGTDNWAESLDGLSAKITAQEKILEAEKKKLEALKAQQERLTKAQQDGQTIIEELSRKHKAAAEEFGETSAEAQKLAKQLSDAESAQKRNADAAEKLRIKIVDQDTAVKDAEQSLDKYKKALKTAEDKTGSLSEKVKSQESALKSLKEQYVKVVTEQGKSSDEAKALGEQISTLSGELKKNRDKLDEAGDAANDLDKSFTDAKKGGLDAFAVALGNLVTDVITGAITKMKQLAEQTVQVGAAFDTEMSKVAAISGATGDELTALREKAKKMGASTQFSASEAASALEYMAMAGWKTDDMLAGISGVMNLAAASGEELASTSDIVTDAMTALGMGADEAGHFADVLAAASSNANTNVSMLGESFKYVAPVAGSMGASAEDLSIALGLMANSGIKGTQAGNSLKNALVNLTKPTKAQAAAMQQLGFISSETVQSIDFEKVEKAEKKAASAALDVENAELRLSEASEKYGADSKQAQIAANNLEKAQQKLAAAEKTLAEEQAGVSKEIAGANTLMTDENGNMRSLREIMEQLRSKMGALNVELTDADGNARDFDDIVGELSQSTEGLAQAEQMQAAATIFGKQNMAGMLAIINASAEDYDKLTAAIDGCDGTAQQMADTMLDNLGGDMTKVKSQLEGVQIMFYEKLEPALRKGADALSGLLDFFAWLINNGGEVVSVLGAIATATLVYLGYTTALKVMNEGWMALTVVQKAAAAGQAVLNAVMAANPIGIIIALIAGLVAAVMLLWNKSEKFRNFCTGMWEEIEKVLFDFFDAVVSGWKTISEKWSAAKKFFSDLWTAIKLIIAAVPGYFKNKFNEAWENTQRVFSGVGAFFSGIWDTIKERFTSIGTKIGDAVGGAFQLAINAVLQTVENSINFVPNAINKALDLLNNLPGVEIPMMPTISLPRLAKGGITNGATVAQIGEAGAEAIIPLERNTGGLKRIAALLWSEMQAAMKTAAAAAPAAPIVPQQTVNNYNSYNFTQTNNSPKALSRLEIYRQSRNLLAATQGVK